MEGAQLAIRLLNDRGYWVFVVTNQAGVARGYYEEADVQRLHRWINAELGKSGAQVDQFYYCPHHPEFDRDCDCRKPKPGMLLQAMKEWPIDLPGSFLIGDKPTDLEAAEHANITGHMFRSGDLHAAVAQVIGQNQID